MLIYATSSDLTSWTGGSAPANADQLLRSASLMIGEATRADIYPVDGTELPTDADLLAAFRDACCAQVATWAALGIDPNLGVAADDGMATRKSIGTATVERHPTAQRDQARADAASTLCADAARILLDAGLLLHSPVVYG